MQNKYIWKVLPSSEPIVIRNCPKCGGQSEYVNTGNFRVNANSSHIDVWLIYQCKNCKSTWNMEILTRVHPSTIGMELYQRFLSNDQDLARQYAFDMATHTRNKSTISFHTIDYVVVGDEIPLHQEECCFHLEVISEFPFNIRLDKLLSSQLGISREQVKRLSNTGKIVGENISDITKAKLKNNIQLTISI